MGRAWRKAGSCGILVDLSEKLSSLVECVNEMSPNSQTHPIGRECLVVIHPSLAFRSVVGMETVYLVRGITKQATVSLQIRLPPDYED